MYKCGGSAGKGMENSFQGVGKCLRDVQVLCEGRREVGEEKS